MHCALLIRAGEFAIITWPGGAQGPVITGAQGMGVKTPIAAEVADDTEGLAIDWHMPNDMMLVDGTTSMILPISMFPHWGRRGSDTISDDGDIPKLHCSIAPIHTKFPIAIHFFNTILHWDWPPNQGRADRHP